MRIAVANWSRRALGGAEGYLGIVIPELARAGHEVALWSELDQPADRELIRLPEGAPEWCAAEMGTGPALEALRAWRPDVVFTHITTGPETSAGRRPTRAPRPRRAGGRWVRGAWRTTTRTAAAGSAR
jgi:hypothetical protein